MTARETIDKLKTDWLADPCFDIGDVFSEENPEYGAFVGELRAFESLHKHRWEQRRIDRLKKTAQRIGCPENLELAAYVESLEHRIREIEEKVRRITFAD